MQQPHAHKKCACTVLMSQPGTIVFATDEESRRRTMFSDVVPGIRRNTGARYAIARFQPKNAITHTASITVSAAP